MRAAHLVAGAVVAADLPDPRPGPEDLLVAVRAAGLNNADLLQRAGRYPAPAGAPADIPGLELAGEVIEVGERVTRFAPGDKVMAVVGGGAQAELAVVHERLAVAVPDGVAWEVAGAVPEAFTTAHDALVGACRLSLGDRVCVHGAAGGVGTAAVQLAVAAGASVVATVRRAELRPAVEALGARAVDPEGFADHGPFDVILELVGASNLGHDVAALAVGGRLHVIGIGSGARAELDLGAVMVKRLCVSGSTLRARPLEGRALAARGLETGVVPLLAAGRVTAPIAATFALEQVAEAYDRFAAGGKLGKIVLLPAP